MKSEFPKVQGEKPRVVYFQRKPRHAGNFSIEFIFEDVRKRLSGDIEPILHLAPFRSNGLFRRLWIALDAAFHQGDINHVTGDINFACLPLSRRKTVLTVLDCVFLTRSHGLAHWLLKTFWLKLPIMRSRLVTTISESSRQEILAHAKCDGEKVRVVPVAISEKFAHKPREFRAECPRILQVGTAPNKNIERLIEALHGLECVLEIVGDLNEPLLENLKRHEIRYENHLNLSLEDVVKRYEECDLLAFVSTYEGFGMPILEANAVGRPVVTANACSMPEVAGDAACLVDPLDVQSIREGIQRVIEDTAYRNALVEKGRANTKRFGGDAIARQYLAIYREVLADQ